MKAPDKMTLIQRYGRSEVQLSEGRIFQAGQRTVSGITLMFEQSKEAKVAGSEETSDYVGTSRIPL